MLKHKQDPTKRLVPQMPKITAEPLVEEQLTEKAKRVRG